MRVRINLRGLLVVVLSFMLSVSNPAYAAEIATGSVADGTVAASPNVLTPTTPELVMTAFATGDVLQFIEVFNQSSAPINMSSVTVLTIDSDNAHQMIALPEGYILSKHFATFSVGDSLISGSLPFISTQNPTSADITQISVIRTGITTQTVNVPKSSGNVVATDDYLWAQHKQRTNVTIKQTGDFATDFVKKYTSPILYSDSLYIPRPSSNGLKLFEINPNPADCSPDVLPQFLLTCRDYIKVVNSGEDTVNLMNYRLRSGAYGDSVSITNTYNWEQPTFTYDDEYLIEPHGYITISLRDDLKPIALTAGDKYVWLEDFYGTKVYDSVKYPDMSLAAYTNSSWGYQDESGWSKAIPSPYAYENLFAHEQQPEVEESGSDDLKPCGEGQYRSVETNRCRTIVVASTLQPCKDGQYRSEETNRCRSILQAVTASLKPCADDQFRNPSTGRCKKIASTDDLPAPCSVGWERNAETNRCRKIVVATEAKAPFAVEPIDTTASSILSIITLTAIAGGGALYAMWEWRQEMLIGAKKAYSLVTSIRK